MRKSENLVRAELMVELLSPDEKHLLFQKLQKELGVRKKSKTPAPVLSNKEVDLLLEKEEKVETHIVAQYFRKSKQTIYNHRKIFDLIGAKPINKKLAGNKGLYGTKQIRRLRRFMSKNGDLSLEGIANKLKEEKGFEKQLRSLRTKRCGIPPL